MKCREEQCQHCMQLLLVQSERSMMGTKWQMVQHVFDNLKVDGVGRNMVFFSALLEVLWGFNQRQQGVQVLEEARRRGAFAEAYQKGRLMWSGDIHRLCTGAALIALAR